MDATAKEDCETIVDILAEQGVAAVMVDDAAPGVPEGTFEVRVPAAEGPKAEQLIAENPLPDEVEEVDASPELDVETIFRAEGSGPMAEMEALEVKGLLEANEIAAVLVGNSVLPNMPFEVKVARDHAERARQLMAEAQQGGEAAAEAAELESEAESGESN